MLAGLDFMKRKWFTTQRTTVDFRLFLWWSTVKLFTRLSKALSLPPHSCLEHCEPFTRLSKALWFPLRGSLEHCRTLHATVQGIVAPFAQLSGALSLAPHAKFEHCR